MVQIMTLQTSQRLAYLDALRGVAILLVLLFHSYVRWPELEPFGNRFAEFPLFKYGWLGVQLFFLISGFVIFMTLEKCQNFADFIKRRWLRLFPAMLAATAIIWLSAPLLPERPAGAIAIRDIIPGLTLIDTWVWGHIFGSPQQMLEGAFWSLFVEVKFYFLIGILYFWLGGRAAIAITFASFLFATSVLLLAGDHGALHDSLLTTIAKESDAIHFGWFASGSLFYLYSVSKDRATFALAIIAAVSAALARGSGHPDILACGIVVGLCFAWLVRSEAAQRLLCQPFLLFVGAVSYPLYLIHENMVVALTIKVGHAATWVPHIAMPLLPIACVIGLAWLIATYAEPRIRKMLRRT